MTRRIFKQADRRKRLYNEALVTETTLRNGRFWVKLWFPGGETSSIQRSNYVWLKNNPAFEYIPDGYVIHHLDYDPTNDDPSNLVLMQKYQHNAHHIKNKTVETIISIDVSMITGGVNKSEPQIRKDKKSGYYLDYWEGERGGRKRKRVYRDDNGRPFKTVDAAERYKKIIWSADER